MLAPGCYDALSARLVEEAGFPGAYMTGFGSSAGYLGRPDVGLMTMAEMVDNARRIVDAVDIPVIADADTGYGNPINVIRTVQAYERAGVAAIHIEDQVAPKKCGHMEGKHVIPAEEMVAKIHAAADARSSPDFLLIYRAAGADILFIEAPQSEAEIRTVAAAFPKVPLLFNYAEGGKTPAVEYSLLAELGFAIIIFPISTMLAATKAMRTVLKKIKDDGSPIAVLPDLPRFGDFVDFIGLPEILELERRYKVVDMEKKQ